MDGLRERVMAMNADYARAIDDDRLEDWPGFFCDPCLYKITTADNHARGLAAGLVYADSPGMLRDRVAALRRANIYERQRYRHLTGLPAILAQDGATASVESPFVVIRIMRDGAMDVFATGRYLDRVHALPDGSVKLAERVVVCDSGRVDTLLALPL
jgi:3-phenylpropionate/cinnamic acid dioxygenase small subunit